jgi:Ser/Thr protein kinase RdoA (MazF antagonist)
VGGRNVVAQEDDTFVLLDWKPSGVGQRLASFATLLQAAIPAQGSGGTPDAAIVDAIASGYREHVELTADERSRLADVMRIHPFYFASWRYWRTVGEGHIPDGTEPWWPDTDVTDAIAERANESLAGTT